MIQLDASRYKKTGFDEMYFEAVWNIVTKPGKKKNVFVSSQQNTNQIFGKNSVEINIRLSLVKDVMWVLKLYEVDGLLEDVSSDKATISDELLDETLREIEDLKKAFRNLILADFRTIKAICDKLSKNTEYMRIIKKINKKRDEEGNTKSNGKVTDEDMTGIALRKIYDDYCSLFRNVSNSRFSDSFNNIDSQGGEIRKIPHMNIRIVQTLGIRTCPYCNKEFIGNRGTDVMGATLDHFFSKSRFPLFALSLYNLIPSCNTCNTVKSDIKSGDMISPFEDINMDDYIRFEYDMTNNIVSIKPIKELKEGKYNAELLERVRSNIKVLKLEEAYAFHSLEVKHFLNRLICYNGTQLEEIQKLMNMNGVKCSVTELQKSAFETVYGFTEDEKGLGQEPLSKLYRDLYKGWQNEGMYRLSGVNSIIPCNINKNSENAT